MRTRGSASARLVIVGVLGALVLGGCGEAPDPGSVPGALLASASAASSPPTPVSLPGLLASVDWPDDEATIASVFQALPEEMSGVTLAHRYPDPQASRPPYEEGGGYSVVYGRGGNSRIVLTADPGAGITSPAHGMAVLVLGAGGPQHCVDADYAALFTDLFRMGTGKDVLHEVQRIMELEPTSGELLWVVCTGTYDDQAPLDEEDWRYVAGWGDGGWYYVVRAPSAAQRTDAVTALVESVKQVQSAG